LEFSFSFPPIRLSALPVVAEKSHFVSMLECIVPRYIANRFSRFIPGRNAGFGLEIKSFRVVAMQAASARVAD